jgi:DNA polymerase I-like protein with 3'-5' exonuclease and polymerase domains
LRKYINDRDEARDAVQSLLECEALAFDIETQPLFRYPKEQTKTAYKAYFAYLKRNRWGLVYDLDPDDLSDPLPPPVDRLAEKQRLRRLLNDAPRGGKTSTRRINDLGVALAALDDEVVPAWVMRHVARLLLSGDYNNDPVHPGLDPRTSRIFLVQFATPSGDAYCFNVRRVGLDVFIPIFERVPLVGANLTFDVQFVLHTVGVFPRVAWDVVVADRVITLGLDVPHSLAAVTERWIGEKLDKSVRETFANPHALEPNPAQVEYALKDAEVLFAIQRQQQRRAEVLGVLDAVRLFVSLTVPTAAVEYCGLRVDAARWNELADEAERRLRAASEQFAEYLGVEPEDLTKRELVKTAAKMRGVNIDSLDRQELGEVEREYEDDPEKRQFFDLYRDWSHWQKRVTTYGRSFLSHIHPLTGRIHPHLKIAGADTGRFACGEPNLLNIPRGEGDDLDYRSAFLAPEGYVFVNADYAAMEQRIAADLSEDPALLALFRSGGDNHSVTAALMFHIRRGDVDEPTPTTLTFQHQPVEGYVIPAAWDARRTVQFVLESGLVDLIGKKYKKSTRQVAKTVAFLYFYGGTPVGLAKKLHITADEAAQFFRDFRAVYPVLSNWFADTARAPFEQTAKRLDGSTAGYVTTYAGLRRWFTLPKPATSLADEKRIWRERGAIRRQAMNHPCQGGNAVIMAQAMSDAFRLTESREGGVEATLGIERMIVAPIYDEALAIVPASLPEDEAQRWLEQVMMNAAQRYMTQCPPAVETNPISKNWRKY